MVALVSVRVGSIYVFVLCHSNDEVSESRDANFNVSLNNQITMKVPIFYRPQKKRE